MSVPQKSSPPLTDSPWFWLFAFALAGFIGLVVIAPKYSQRKAQADASFDQRKEATQKMLSPLYLGLGAASCIGWVVIYLAIRRRRLASQAGAGSASEHPQSSQQAAAAVHASAPGKPHA